MILLGQLNQLHSVISYQDLHEIPWTISSLGGGAVWKLGRKTRVIAENVMVVVGINFPRLSNMVHASLNTHFIPWEYIQTCMILLEQLHHLVEVHIRSLLIRKPGHSGSFEVKPQPLSCDTPVRDRP